MARAIASASHFRGELPRVADNQAVMVPVNSLTDRPGRSWRASPTPGPRWYRWQRFDDRRVAVIGTASPPLKESECFETNQPNSVVSRRSTLRMSTQGSPALPSSQIATRAWRVVDIASTERNARRGNSPSSSEPRTAVARFGGRRRHRTSRCRRACRGPPLQSSRETARCRRILRGHVTPSEHRQSHSCRRQAPQHLRRRERSRREARACP
jgi:hypothetical protein